MILGANLPVKFYATIALSKFSTCPHDHHFALLKKVAQCICASKDWGIVYRNPVWDPTLPPSNHIQAILH